ncbi:Vibriobactin utilization protein ViuB [Kluyvera cryocrescens]|uniref:Vibriobactin utilization protein ViuB n=1 Tax=Kluyvera cryocrescens TaxID=580 RepID=A0A485D113_KLUCR|nr:Vibriobactin utilization protein ViuB [Kluyvera cryocrescens]
MAVVPGYRLFNVRLARRSEVSPSLLSLVFSGEEVAQMKSDSPDQRIKMLFPAEDGTPPSLPVEGEWYPTLLAIPKDQRPIVRTYTLRPCRSCASGSDGGVCPHGTEGPASAWAINAKAGDALQIVAPNAEQIEDSGGYEWTPPVGFASCPDRGR